MIARRLGLVMKVTIPARLMLVGVLLFVAQTSAMAQIRAEEPQTVVRDDSTIRGWRSHALTGAGIGFVVGAGATFAVLYGGGSTGLCNQSANQDAMTRRECLAVYAVGGMAGAGMGAVIGAQFKRFRVALTPLPTRRVGLTLAVAF